MKARSLALAIAMATVLHASEPLSPIPLWPTGAPGQYGIIDAEKNKSPGDKVMRLTNITNPTIAVFPAPQDKANGAAVLVCPGGGYCIVSYDLEGTEICEWLNSIGVTAVLLKYRVPYGREKPLQDVQRAMGLVRQHAKEWKIDPNRVGIIGFSAGAHLAASLSAHSDQRTYNTVDSSDSLSCHPDFAMLIYPAYLVLDSDTSRVAPEVTPTEKTPPTFLAQTEDDGIHVECSLGYYLALKKAKVTAELHLYAKGGHGYGLRPARNPVSTAWPKHAAEWMKDLGILSPAK